MIQQRKFLWRRLIGSLVLGTLLLAACSADIPEETIPTEAAIEHDEVTAADPESTIAEVFGETAVSPDSSSANVSSNTAAADNTDALPADTEIDANGVPIGFTEAGHPYRGNPNAPVVIEEFSDYQ